MYAPTLVVVAPFAAARGPILSAPVLASRVKFFFRAHGALA